MCYLYILFIYILLMQELKKIQIITQEQEKEIQNLKAKFATKKQQLENIFKENFNIDVNRILNKNGNYITYVSSFDYKQIDNNTINRYFQCILSIQKEKMYYLEKENNLRNKIIHRLSQEISTKSKVKNIKNITDLLNIELQNQNQIKKMSQSVKEYQCQIDSLKKKINQRDKRQKVFIQKTIKQIKKLPIQFQNKFFDDKQIAVKAIQDQVISIIIKAKKITQNNQNLIITLKQNLNSFNNRNLLQENQKNERLNLNLIQKQKQFSSLKSELQKLGRQNESLKQLIQKQREKSKISFDKCKSKILSLRQERDERFYELELLQKMKNEQIGKLQVKLKTQRQNNICQEQISQNQLKQVNQKKKKYKLTIAKFTEQAKANSKILKIIIEKISKAKLIPQQGQNKLINNQQISEISITSKLQLFKNHTKKLIAQIQRIKNEKSQEQSQKQNQLINELQSKINLGQRQ